MSLARKIAVWVTGALALASLGCGIWFLCEARAWMREMISFTEREPVRMAVDLSKPGEYRGYFHHTLIPDLGLELALEIQQPPGSPAIGPEALAEFEGGVTLQDARGVTRMDGRMDPKAFIKASSDMFGPRRHAEGLFLPLSHYLLPYEFGDYTLVVTVRKPAPALAGLRQELAGQYILDPSPVQGTAFIIRALAVISFIFSGLMMLLLYWIVRRGRHRRAAGPQA